MIKIVSLKINKIDKTYL